MTGKITAHDKIAGLSPNACSVLDKRYLRRDHDGKVLETAGQMFHRVAETVAAADLTFDKNADVKKLSDDFYRIMTSLELSLIHI